MFATAKNTATASSNASTAKPKLIPTFVKFDSYLLKSMQTRDFTPTEKSILTEIVIKTAGFHRDSAIISLSVFEANTGIAERHASPAIQSLLDMGVIDRQDTPLGLGHRYTIQNVDSWQVPFRPMVKPPIRQFYTVYEDESNNSKKHNDFSPSETRNPPLPKSGSMKEYPTKDKKEQQRNTAPESFKPVVVLSESDFVKVTLAFTKPYDPHMACGHVSFPFGDLVAESKSGLQGKVASGSSDQSGIQNAESYPLPEPPIALESTFTAEPCQTITANFGGREMAFPIAGVQDLCRSMPPFSIRNGSTPRLTKEPAPQPKPKETEPNLVFAGDILSFNGSNGSSQQTDLTKHLHPSVDPKDAKAIIRMVSQIPEEDALDVLEELFARLAGDGEPIRNPASFVFRLVERVKAGTFAPAAGRRAADSKQLEAQRISLERAGRTKAAAELATEEQRQATLAAAMATLEPDQLEALRAEFLAELQAEKPFMFGIFKRDDFTGPIFDGSFRQFCAKKLLSG